MVKAALLFTGGVVVGVVGLTYAILYNMFDDQPLWEKPA